MATKPVVKKVCITLTPNQLHEIESAAAVLRLPLATWIRMAALLEAHKYAPKPNKEPVKKTKPLPTVYYNGKPWNELTDDEKMAYATERNRS